MFKELLQHDIIITSMQDDGRWGLLLKSNLLLQISASELIPTSIQEQIRLRLHQLTPPARTLLMASAVLQQELTFERLCQVARIDEQAGLQALEELLCNQLLSEVGPEEATASPGEYSFPYEAIRAIAYQEAGKTRQRLFQNQTTTPSPTDNIHATNQR